MSVESDILSGPAPAAPVAAATLPRRRLFYWSVRRELWENRSVYLAPLAVAAVGLLGYLLSAWRLPHALRLATATADAAHAAGPANAALAKAARSAANALVLPYDAVTGVILVAGMAVAVFYSLAALHNERRDRSMLFWKSLPVSDRMTVASKVAIPLLVQPLVVYAIVIPVHFVMLAISSTVLLASGLNPLALWPYLHMTMIWVSLAYGLVVLPLWYAPICGWLMLVSAWARRAPILWAIAPPLGLCLFELLAFGSHQLWSLLMFRLGGGLDHAFTVAGQGRDQITRLDQLDPVRFLSQPGLWSGLVFAAACFAACVWLRRRREPI